MTVSGAVRWAVIRGQLSERRAFVLLAVRVAVTNPREKAKFSTWFVPNDVDPKTTKTGFTVDIEIEILSLFL
jgi:hypothetical protein